MMGAQARRAAADSPEVISLTAALAAAFGDHSGRHISLGFERRAGGRPIATEQAQTGELIGLHVDSWTGRPVTGRRGAGNRLCLNLGDEVRRLVLVNAPISRIAATMKQLEGIDVEQTNPTEIGRRFLERFPSFPVLRLTIQPGQAYIAPTETIVHDGDTSGCKTDCFTTVLGKFPFAPAQAHLAGKTDPRGALEVLGT
jgi:hypothetical protein